MQKLIKVCFFVLVANVAFGQEFNPSLYVPNIVSYPAFQEKIEYKWPHNHNVPKFVGLVVGYQGFRSSFYQMGLAVNFVEMLSLPGGMLGGQILYKRHFSENIQSYSAEIGFYQIICGGINLNYHVQEERGTFGVKPFIGLSMYHIQFLFGYNVYSDKKNTITPLMHGSLELRYVIPIISFGKDKEQMVLKSTNYPNTSDFRLTGVSF